MTYSGEDMSEASGSIAAGQTASEIFDLGRPYNYVTIRITDCQHIPITTSLRVLVGIKTDDTMCYVGQLGISGISLITLPTSGTFSLTVTIRGARRVQVALSNAASGGAVPVEVYGIESPIH